MKTFQFLLWILSKITGFFKKPSVPARVTDPLPTSDTAPIVMDGPRIMPVVPTKVFSIKNIVSELPKHKTKRYNTRSLSLIKEIIVHHSATKEGTPHSFARFHVETRGWAGIGYHFVIDKAGQIFQTNYLETISYHTSGRNMVSFGVCLVGDFDEENPTDVQWSALIFLLALIRENYKVPIGLHRMYANKTCPGKNITLSEINTALTRYESDNR